MVQPFMYIQTILLNKSSGTDKHPTVGTYCCYNCFSHGDIRIRCTFPGSHSPQVQFVPSKEQEATITIGSNPDDHTKQLWKETQVSGIVRAMLFSDQVERQLPGLCQFNPITSSNMAHEIIDNMCSLLPKGMVLGYSDLINQPTICENNLVDALLKLIKIVGYHRYTIKCIENLEESDSTLNFNVLKAKILLTENNQLEAVKLMYQTLKINARDGWMLQLQAQFLIGKNRPDLALVSAQRAIECLPTEFICWMTLVKIYIIQGDFKNALLALNSSPMYANKKKDIHPALKPKNFEFPLPDDGRIDSVWNDCETFGCISGFGDIVEFSPLSEVSTLSPLHAEVYEQTKLQATFKEAYTLLAFMTRQLGWTELLRIRSEIFVMDDEYNASLEMEKKKQMDHNRAVQLEAVNKKNSTSRKASLSSSKSSIKSISRISAKFKRKRLSERWLDSLFLIFYENLKSVLIWENERRGMDEIEHSALEWELIGDECFNVHHYESGIAPFMTAIGNRFSIFASQRLLEYYLYYTENWVEIRLLNQFPNKRQENLAPYLLDTDFVLKITCELLCWNHRYYGEFSVLCIRVLRRIIETCDVDTQTLKGKVAVLLAPTENGKDLEKEAKSPKLESRRRSLEIKQGISGIVDRYLSWIELFNGGN